MPNHPDEVLARIRAQARENQIRFTLHANQEMVEEGFTLVEVVHAIACGEILEDYPDEPRGACCLLNGKTGTGRPLHLVCTTAQPVLVVITVYEPKPPKWPTPTQRRIKP